MRPQDPTPGTPQGPRLRGPVDRDALADWTKLNKLSREAYYLDLHLMEQAEKAPLNNPIRCCRYGCETKTKSASGLCKPCMLQLGIRSSKYDPRYV